MRVLGIETSCDETAAAVVEDGEKLLSNVVASSLDLHIPFGGVVPEIAARSHLEVILPTIDEALKQAETDWGQIDVIAVTQGPGLLGSLLIGVLTARTLAVAKSKPLYGVNHVQAHVYASFLTEAANSSKLKAYSFPKGQPKFPLLAMIVSGGHSHLVLFESHNRYKILGRTRDDAVGEAFDKVAKMLGLPYPGGPSINRVAQDGNPNSISLPTAKMENRYDFSFSGLKTAVLRAAQKQSGHDFAFPSSKLPGALNDAQKADIAASFQQKALETLINTLKEAIEEFHPKSIVVAGGVAASPELRRQAEEQITQSVIFPDIKLCTDNAAMIAALGYYLASNKQPLADPCSLEPDPSLQMLG